MNYLDEVREYLNLPPAKKIQVLRELELHYNEIEEGLVASGMSARDAAAEAGRRFGDPAVLAKQLYRVHCPASRYIGWTILLLIGSFWLAVMSMFMPMIQVINNVAGEGNGAAYSPSPTSAWFGPLASAAAVMASALTVFLAVKGVKGDIRRRVLWGILLVLAVLALLLSVVVVAVLPQFAAMFKDLGITP